MARTALITGASSGLGEAYARLFARDSYDLVLVARREARLMALGEALEAEHGISTSVVPSDLSADDSPRGIYERLQSEGIEVSFLVNNAGFGHCGPFCASDQAQVQAMIQVNIGALTALTGLFLPRMIERGFGHVLNIGSTAGFQAGPNMAVYYATKAYVNSFTEALSHELKGTGVYATASCPGPVATEFAERAGIEKTRLFQWSVADCATTARQGYRAMFAKRPLAVHGFQNRVGIQAVRFAPRSWVRSFVGRINSEVQGQPELESGK